MSKILQNILGDDLDDEFESILNLDQSVIPQQPKKQVEEIIVEENTDLVVQGSNDALKFNVDVVNTKVADVNDFLTSDGLGVNTSYLINDFVYVRNEIVDMTKNGKTLLKKILEDSDEEGFLKPGVLQAYGELNASLSQNLRLLMNMYEKIFKFSAQTKKEILNNKTTGNIGTQQVNSNCDVKNIFALSSNDLLKALQELDNQQ